MDAAHAMDRVMCRSITGLVIMLCDGPMAFNSQVQDEVNGLSSSTEAKFLTAVRAAKFAKYLWSILFELGYPQHGPIMS